MERVRNFAVWTAVIIVALVWLFSEPKQQSSAATGGVTPAIAAPTGGLSDLHLGNLRWSTGITGSIMEASFSLTNQNRYAVKDLVVLCVHKANSGTVIDSNTRTVYERIPPGQTILVHEMNMGFIHNQAQTTRCGVTGFSPA